MVDEKRKKRSPYIVQYWDAGDNNCWVIASRHFNEISANANYEVRCQSKSSVRLIHDGKIIREQSNNV